MQCTAYLILNPRIFDIISQVFVGFLFPYGFEMQQQQKVARNLKKKNRTKLKEKNQSLLSCQNHFERSKKGIYCLAGEYLLLDQLKSH